MLPLMEAPQGRLPVRLKAELRTGLSWLDMGRDPP